ncbi:MAG: dihydrofolate reductase family protein [Solirubrobacterales bacterium]
MGRTVYYAAMSLDGYIAEPEERLDWLMGFDGPGYAGDDGSSVQDAMSTFMAEVGSMVMGSKTYEFLLREGSWPYGDTPTWVYTSRELETIEGAGALKFASGNVTELHAEMLAAADGKDVWMIGGGNLGSQYVAARLLDQVRVTVVPVILGDGLPLFAEPLAEPMRLLDTTSFDNGMVELSYEIVR